MTNQEAIDIIKCLAWHTRPDEEDVEQAIKALEQEPSGDLINRDELLRAMDTWDKFGVDDTNSLFRLDNLSLPHYVPYIHYDDVIKCIKGMPSVNPVPSGDLISRQATLKPYEGLKDDDVIAVWLIRKNIEQQLSVNPQEPKTGHWTKDECGNIICSECKRFRRDCRYGHTNYCNHCGAKMVEPQESEDKE